MKKKLSREQLIVAECYHILQEQNNMDISKVFKKNSYYVGRMRTLFRNNYKGRFYNLYIDNIKCYLIAIVCFLPIYYIRQAQGTPFSHLFILYCLSYACIEFFVFKGWNYYIGQHLRRKNKIRIKCKFYFPYFIIKRVHLCKYRGNICIYDDYTIPSDCYIQASYFCDYVHLNDVIYDFFKNNQKYSIDNVRKPISYRIWEDYCNILYDKWEG